VHARVGVSKIHGLGIIAREFIPKGTVTWKLIPGFDVILSEEEVQNLSPSVQEQVRHYAFFHPQLKMHVLCSDDARFTNHSDEANENFCGDYSVAVRDIPMGEELTENYKEYGHSWDS
jgi:uncharacterized protein